MVTTTPPIYVVQTWFIQSAKHGEFYQIELAHAPRDPRLVLVTRDPHLYAQAVAVESLMVLVVAEYDDRRPRGVLRALTVTGDPDV